jgi:hypothetical protein
MLSFVLQMNRAAVFHCRAAGQRDYALDPRTLRAARAHIYASRAAADGERSKE